MTISPWKKLHYRFEWLGVVVLAKLVPLLPRRLHLALARGLGRIAFYLDAHGRRSAIENLLAAYPGGLDAGEARRIARFWEHGHSTGTIDVPAEEPGLEYPYTLDLRRRERC